MKPVPSAPDAIISRIAVAKQSIENDKERARENGREYLPHFGPLGFTEKSVCIFEKLACDPNMEIAWKRLKKLFDDTKLYPDTWSLADYCYQIIGSWDFSPKRTSVEHKEYFDKIASDLRSVVIRIVSEPEFGTIGLLAASVSSLDMIKSESFQWLLDEMNADPIDGHYIKNEEAAVSYLDFCLRDIIPNLYEYGEWIAKRAEEIASQASISERPHSGSAGRIFFIKRLSYWFREKFGKPMHEIVACIACALFDEVVTADAVRKVVGKQSEPSRLFRGRKPPFVR